MNKGIKIGIGVPLSHENVPFAFLESLIAMRKPTNFILIRASGYVGIANMRNQLVKAALENDCSHLLFLDIDHYHNPETMTRLLSHNKPIVAGLSFMRTEPYEPAMFRGQINSYKTVTEWEKNSLIEVDTVGCAAMLVQTEVFKKIGEPYFQFMKNPNPDIPYDIGEDVCFCNKAKEFGYKIYVDTALPNKHMGYIGVDEDFWRIWTRGQNEL